jgi:hypothetical protein
MVQSKKNRARAGAMESNDVSVERQPVSSFLKGNSLNLNFQII